jgi:SAM-dependent methyltransferase
LIPIIKKRVKANPALKRLSLVATRAVNPLTQRFRPSAILRYAHFVADWLHFRHAGGQASVLDLYPCLFDKTATSSIDTHYFYQAVWAFTRILSQKPYRHVDLGSQLNLVGLLTTITRIIFLDIRPLVLTLNNYSGLAASIPSLPLQSDTILSLSSLHVIEHIGLGRYGDRIDPLGPERACREIARVLKPGGNAYISVPIGRPRVSFNGLRVFDACEVVKLFAGLDLREMAMIDVPGNFIPNVEPEHADIRESEGGSDFGLGLFWFQKPGLSREA